MSLNNWFVRCCRLFVLPIWVWGLHKSTFCFKKSSPPLRSWCLRKSFTVLEPLGRPGPQYFTRTRREASDWVVSLSVIDHPRVHTHLCITSVDAQSWWNSIKTKAIHMPAPVPFQPFQSIHLTFKPVHYPNTLPNALRTKRHAMP